MIEIRIHGRGGQGGVTTGQLIAISAFNDGMYSQTFPVFGVERCGAPVEAFVRIDEKQINLHCQVYEPDVILVLDSSLLNTVDVTQGLKEGGMIIINTNKKVSELGIRGNYKIYAIDATKIALDTIHKPIINTPLLGAFAKITGLVTLNSMKKAAEERFAKKEVADFNKKAIETVFHKTDMI